MLITYRKRLFDRVDSRKSHVGVIPRLGGVAFAPVQCCLMTIIVVVFHQFNLINDLHIDGGSVLPMFSLLVTGLVILFMTGIADDLVGVSYKLKFMAQLLVASFFPLSGLWINDFYGVLFITEVPAWFGMPFTVFGVILIINAINLIDGLDGLCSGLVLVSCVVLGSLFAFEGAWLHAVFAFVTAGIVLPFFYFNVYGASKRKRRIFMGDTGSLTLGYSVSFLAVSYAMNNPVVQPFSEGAIVVAFSTLFVPVMDVARVMFVRWHKGLPVFQPDRNHIHHLLLDLGIPHRRVMLWILLLSACFSVFNLVGVNLISNNIVIALDLLLWGGFHLYLNRRIMRERKQSSANSPKGEEYRLSGFAREERDLGKVYQKEINIKSR